MGFEPTRAEPIGIAVQRLNHSATSSRYFLKRVLCNQYNWTALFQTKWTCEVALI